MELTEIEEHVRNTPFFFTKILFSKDCMDKMRNSGKTFVMLATQTDNLQRFLRRQLFGEIYNEIRK